MLSGFAIRHPGQRRVPLLVFHSERNRDEADGEQIQLVNLKTYVRIYTITLEKCFLRSKFIVWKKCCRCGRNLLMCMFTEMSINWLDWTEFLLLQNVACFKREPSFSFPPWTTGTICSLVYLELLTFITESLDLKTRRMYWIDCVFCMGENGNIFVILV
jgi:hypothetical protein